MFQQTRTAQIAARSCSKTKGNIIVGNIARRRLWMPAAALLLLPACGAQKSTTSVPRSSSGNIGSGPAGAQNSSLNPTFSSVDPERDARLEHLRDYTRAAERQKRMVDDANRLVALTTRYRASVSEHGKETAEDARLLLDIEKLARSVKDRMRGM